MIVEIITVLLIAVLTAACMVLGIIGLVIATWQIAELQLKQELKSKRYKKQ